MRADHLPTVLATLVLVISACGTSSTGTGTGIDGPDAPPVAHSTAGVGAAGAPTPHFTEVAEDSGLIFGHGAFRWSPSADPVAMMGGGVCWLDANGDGWEDLLLVNSYATREAGRWQAEGGGLPTSALFLNHDGRFTDATTEAGLDVPARGNGCATGDLDGDGDPDIYVTTARSNLLFWNDGTGRFTEGGSISGTDAYGWHTGAAIGDLNGDGRADIFVAGYVDLNSPRESPAGGFPNTFAGVRDLVFLNRGSPEPGTEPVFEEVGRELGLDSAAPDYGLGVTMADLDGDGDLDVYVANDTNPNRLYVNEPRSSAPGFSLTDTAASLGVDDEQSGMGVAVADSNADGAVDLAVTNFGPQTHTLLLGGPGNSAFRDGRSELGVPDLGVGETGWGTNWFDADLDGRPDLLTVHGGVPVLDLEGDREPLALYLNHEGILVDATVDTGLAGPGDILGRGSAVADYDNDGDPDFVVATIGGPPRLFRNDLTPTPGRGRHWLELDLGGRPTGTTVEVTTSGGEKKRGSLTPGGSYLSTDAPRIIFALPDDRPVTVTVRTPGGRVLFVGVENPDQILDLRPDW